ncbi:hypothetical protein BOO69_10790 [Sulfitobacter alexandrii]|uniref:Uncharacterized protein n=1 Tax=Sulfitobacter alexandrii TaxID=1917485 RepID=A0A1J0WI83_9RHOB|nr:hypothetical protein [Sulfitobacter alexandrii]APE43846.1 hypothetical protein BOO69_10790 [Sulfitobacter alexandrii]
MPDRRMFLERRSYRRRRLMDAVRMWPLVGLALWMLPLLWPLSGDDSGAAMPMSSALRYLFGVWVVLILGALALWWRTGRGVQDEAAAVDPAGRRG